MLVVVVVVVIDFIRPGMGQGGLLTMGGLMPLKGGELTPALHPIPLLVLVVIVGVGVVVVVTLVVAVTLVVVVVVVIVEIGRRQQVGVKGTIIALVAVVVVS